MPEENMDQEFRFKKIDEIRNCLIKEIGVTSTLGLSVRL